MKKICLFLILLITGCTKYNDLSELTIIKSIGISYNEKYYIYAQVIENINDINEPKMEIIEGNGKNIQESFKNLENSINKNIYLSHIDLLILSNNLNKKNYDDIINFFINNNRFRNDFYCVFSSNPKSVLEKSQYDEIEIFLKTKRQNMLVISFDEVIKDYLNNNTITLPNISYNDTLSYLGNYQYKRRNK